MLIQTAKKLKAGETIHWEDPDNGLCSRTGVIKKVRIIGQVVRITWEDDSVLEAFPEELG